MVGAHHKLETILMENLTTTHNLFHKIAFFRQKKTPLNNEACFTLLIES